MPLYSFRVPGPPETVPANLANDDEAWAQAVVLCGEMLKDIDGALPPGTEWDLTVCEGKRTVATIKVLANRHPEPKKP